MRIKFQADADLNVRVIRGLKRIAPEIDFRSAQEAGLEGIADCEVLRLAADTERVLVSQDRRTMPAHFNAFILSAQSPGVLLVRPNTTISALIQELLLIWTASDHDDLRQRLIYIPL